MDEGIKGFPFEHLNNLKNISYKGSQEGHVSRFECSQNGQHHVLLVNAFVHPEEADIWASCEDMFSLILGQMEEKFKNIFRFELLYLDLRKGLDQFQQCGQ